MAKTKKAPTKPPVCNVCGQPIEEANLFKHWWEQHPEWARDNLKKANKARGLNDSGVQQRETSDVDGDSNDDGNSPNPTKTSSKPTKTTTQPKVYQTHDPSEAQTYQIVPRAFTMSSTMLWMAKRAAVSEWGWDPELTMEDFLDTYLYISFKQRGIVLGGYTVTDQEPEEGNNGGS